MQKKFRVIGFNGIKMRTKFATASQEREGGRKGGRKGGREGGREGGRKEFGNFKENGRL